MIAFGRYLRLLREPGVGSSLLASVIGRLPIGIAAFSIVLFVQARSGSFASAGIASACYVLGLGLLAPVAGRLIDRFGPRPVLIATAVGYPLALAALILLVSSAASALWTGASALLAGALLPPVTICTRALLPRLLRDAGQLHTAYSVDSVLIEFMFVVGPLLVALFIAHGSPAGAVALAAFTGGAGAWIFLGAPAIRAWKVAAAPARRNLFGPLHDAKLRRLFTITFLYSTAFGLFEIAATAFAIGIRMPAAAGALLAAASIGSAFGALIYGSHDWHWPPQRQFVLALALMALGMLPLTAVTNLYLFGALCLIGCMPMAPVLAIQSVLTSHLAPPAMAAESFTWGATCLLAGIGAGTTVGGLLVEAWSPAAAFVAAAAMTMTGAALAWRLLGDGSRNA
ncbi:MAG TPA: MFS transporter [Burkholderiales bacterium]|nr:MFS transporter [Burkholderiales bacterium]